MIVCGPNGVGKTTLLDAIGRRQGINFDDPATKICVAPATRTWRKEPVVSRWLYGNDVTADQVYELTGGISQYANRFSRQVYSGTRDLWSDDDAKQLVKPLLAKLKSRWRDFAAREIETQNYSTVARQWPNPSIAIADFTASIFEELRYVDTTEKGDNTHILFSSVNRPAEQPLDIDELSSGEKAVFSIFLSVIEEDFERKLGRARRQVVVVIDEVENHLHPSLQLRLLDYMRKKAKDGYQFICTTHSTTLIKASAQTELFHVLPKGLTVGNQLRRAAAETHSLVEVMQEHVLFASGYQRHILCEGFDPEKRDENNICDSELYTTLLDLDSHVKLIAGGSADAVTAGTRATAHTVFAPLCLASINDGDGKSTLDQNTTWTQLVLPVYSLESILLDRDAISSVLSRYSITPAAVDSAIAQAIQAVTSERMAQLLNPSAILKRKDGLTAMQALDELAKGTPFSLFDMRPTAASDLAAELSTLQTAAANRQLALKVVKGKKIYHHLFGLLNLGGRAFTQRSFAEAVAKQVRQGNAFSWLNDFTRIARCGVGNALSSLLFGPAGDPIRRDPTHQESLISLWNMVDRVELNDFAYGVLKPEVRIEEFAQHLSRLSVATTALVPSLKWH